MATAQAHCLEPPPRLYMGVDYRWDPLFFRIPSPREPAAAASCVSHGRGADERGHSPDTAPPSSGGPSRGQVASVPRPLRRQEAGGEGSRPSSAARSPPTRSRRAGANPAVPPPPRDQSLLRSPRLTRSTILLREFNASGAPSNQPPRSPLELTNQVSAAAPRTSADAGGARLTSRRGDGTVLPSALAVGGAALRHPQDHAWVPARCAAPLTPRGTRAATLRVEQVRRKLNLAKLRSGPAARPQHFERTDAAAGAARVTVEGNRHNSGGGAQRRSEVPPVPTLSELRALHTTKQSPRTKRGNAAWDSSNGINAATKRSWAAKARERLLRSEAAATENGVCHAGACQLSTSCNKEGILLTSTEVGGDSGGGAVVPVDEVEEMPEEDALSEDPDACDASASAGKQEGGVRSPVQSGSCAEEGTAGPCREELQPAAASGDKGDRERTLPPVDMAESLHEWSSDPFSEDAGSTPHNLPAEEVGEVVDTPSYWRAETLPMVEAAAARAAPSEVSAEEDLSPTITPGGSEAGGVAVALAGEFPLPSDTKDGLAERMTWIPRYLLLECAAAQRRQGVLLTPGATLHKYKTLQRGVRAYAMRRFFNKWAAWVRLPAVARCCASVAHPASATRGGGDATPLPFAAPMEPLPTPGGGTGAPDEAHAVHQEGTEAARETPSRGRCATPTQPQVPLRAKGPLPLSRKLLEEVVGGSEQRRTTVQDAEPACNSKSSSFAASSLTSWEDDCVSPRPRSARAEDDGDWFATEGTLLESLRPSAPINCDVQEMALLPSGMSSASLKTRSTLSAEDSRGSLDMEEVLPAPRRSASPLHRIKYLHSEL
ncbi:uncharacterized protein Tco025E_00419 [Trypanosoma conorhini]|uniref:Uncharacterized protein n=1 Tax=Trypanosoma conorhini TaxID=83891 RepID=A0A422QBL7_9TRYP|nr:uncharacterized protein Tco025E_00419 [Trypanosoma conorhini]RNF27349.1 hypothetical protein Tco025E_00419 [Trypanosoma conorhini]